MWYTTFYVPEESLCVSPGGVILSVTWKTLHMCVTVWCSSLCVSVEPQCVCWLLVEAYQCRQLSAQLASPSFIQKDVIVRGPYLGVCL